MELLSLRSNLDLISPARANLSLDQAYRKTQIVKDQIGISRVGEIGRFIDKGIYVCQATRPNLFHHYNIGLNTGSQGKGYTRKQAYISAVMETAESFCAEPRVPTLIHGSYNQLKKTHAIAEPSLFIPKSFNSSVDNNEKLMWSWSLHCQSGEEVLVPSELVYTFHIPELYGDRVIFPASSAGLAAGFDDYSTTVRALSELVEQHYRGRSESLDVKIEAFIVDGKIAEIINRLPKSFNKKYETHFFSFRTLDSKQQIPYVTCYMGDESRYYQGWGLNIDPLKAIESAHVEAFQSWATIISGARENISGKFRKSKKVKLPRGFAQKFEDAWPDEQTLTFSEFEQRFKYRGREKLCDLDVLKNIIQRSGFSNIFLVNLSRVGLACSVVKAIVPQLSLSLSVHRTPDQIPKLNHKKLVEWQYLVRESNQKKRRTT